MTTNNDDNIRESLEVENNKLNARKKTIDGITFDSGLEADYYVYLKEQKANNLIYDFQVKPDTYELVPEFTKNGKKYNRVTYTPDFKIYESPSKFYLVDTKGFRTDVFIIKNKLFNYIYPDLELKLICRDKYGKFVTIEEKAKQEREHKKKLRKREKERVVRIAAKEKAKARKEKKSKETKSKKDNA